MIIALSGKARVGKDTFGGMLAESMYEINGKQFIIMAYAYELKVRVQKDFDLTWDQLWGNEKEVPDKRYSKPDNDGFWTPREILQNYGQFFRSIDKDFWVKRLFNVIEDKGYENVIITDARHPNEIDPVIDRDGYHIRIFRDDKDMIHNDTHISETALDSDDVRVDFKIMNNSDLDSLLKTAKDVVGNINVIEQLMGNKK